MISGTSNILIFFWTRSGPLHPLFIIKIFQNIQENPNASLKHITFTYLNILEIHKMSNTKLDYLTETIICIQLFSFSQRIHTKRIFYDGGISMNFENMEILKMKMLEV